VVVGLRHASSSIVDGVDGMSGHEEEELHGSEGNVDI
jgi:hypothetical protein